MINNKNIFSSDAVKCNKLQIWPLNHEVLQTQSYLSHLRCYACNLIPDIRIFIGTKTHVETIDIASRFQPVFVLRHFGHLLHINIKISHRVIPCQITQKDISKPYPFRI